MRYQIAYEVKLNGKVFYARDYGTTVKVAGRTELKHAWETAGQLIRRLYPGAEIYPIGTSK